MEKVRNIQFRENPVSVMYLKKCSKFIGITGSKVKPAIRCHPPHPDVFSSFYAMPSIEDGNSQLSSALPPTRTASLNELPFL